MKIHKEGQGSILTTILVIFSINALLNLVWPTQTVVHYIIYTLSGLLFVTVLQFFRNPARSVARDENHIICPADGKIVVIEKTQEDEYFKDQRLQVSVFMSPVNVHVNRYPVGGEVKFSQYHPGKYLVAWHPKSSTDNERTTVVIEEPKNGPVLMRQIAGALARRIVCYSKVGDKAEQGKEMGFIKFGSRVDIFLPTTANVKVKVGETVKGGKTVLASFS